MRKRLIISVIFCALTNAQYTVDKYSSAFDKGLYKQVLNKELCNEQIRYMIMNNTFLLSRFVDASARVPRGIGKSNFADFGNYYQCLEINESYKDSKIAGKYCIIQVPLYQELLFSILPGFPNSVESADINTLKLGPVPTWILEKYMMIIEEYRSEITHNNIDPHNPLRNFPFHLAVCIPRVCTVSQADALFLNIKSIGFQYNEEYCRLPNDKPWRNADYVAVITFSIISVLTLLSTIYELIYVFVLQRDEESNDYWRSFSLYNNTRLLLHFPKKADTLRCCEGLKVISVICVICIHTFTSRAVIQNQCDWDKWMASTQSTVITMATIYVDTFFVITGILVVYLTANKMDGILLLKNLHVFYLKRLLRMFPLLAAAIIFDASIFHKISDGPVWTEVAMNADRCRNFWWSTLLNIQNYLDPRIMCVKHSWYVAVDMQLHVLSPVLLFWLVNGRRKCAWTAIMVTLVAALSASAVYNYSKECPSSQFDRNRWFEMLTYMSKYLMHIMSRITPFLVGMIIGYVLHLWRRKKIIISKILIMTLWLMTFGVISLTVYTQNRIKQGDWNNQAVDNVINTVMRPTWAAAIGWMVVACVHGYGGPVNWILSLEMWRLPGRLTYGMYLFHYPIIDVVCGRSLTPTYFTVANSIYQFMAYTIASFIVSFILTVSIEIPFKIWFKSFLDRCTVTTNRRRQPEGFDVYELTETKDYD